MKEKHREQINIHRPELNWLLRAWRRIAGERKQTVQDMIIEIVNQRLRSEDDELNRKLTLLEEAKKL